MYGGGRVGVIFTEPDTSGKLSRLSSRVHIVLG